MSKVCIIAWVYGRVQGVGFRYTTQYEAKKLRSARVERVLSEPHHPSGELADFRIH